METNKLIRKINANNRLLLTANDFKLLYRYALAKRKARRYYENKHLPIYNIDELEKLETKAAEILEQFYASFGNPFELDMEMESDSSSKSIYFDFYDYDYLYRAFKCKDGWLVEFYEAFYHSADHNDHSLGVGYRYNIKTDKFYPISICNDVYITTLQSFELTLQS